jgi:putative tryptophan/tyrosine transport system substrate-binding protein
MRRRDFVKGLAVAGWPVVARAQQRDRVRRIGALMNFAADDAEGQKRLAAFLKGLQNAGWERGRNLQLDVRWGTGDVGLYSKYAMELIALEPEVVLASGIPAAREVQKASRAVSIVFATAADPVGAGMVANVARPGGNVTGFTAFAYNIGGKWLELLLQIAPNTTRVGIVRDPEAPAGIGQFGTIQAVAPSMKMVLSAIDSRDPDDIERGMTEIAGETNSGLIVTQNASVLFHRKQIIALAAKYRLPAVYATRTFVAGGGLLSYGANLLDNYQRAAGYVDLILKGTRAGELPIQEPTAFELIINLKTANAIGLKLPSALLNRADEVIE